MPDELRVQELLDELLDRDSTPEEVCSACPELLPVVRERWRQICRARAEVDALLPAGLSAVGPAVPPGAGLLPAVPGYEVEAVIGHGGMGVVFRARHLRLNRVVALKMMLAGAYAGPHERGRFQREAEAVAALRHPNVVQVHDVGDSGGQPYFTTEFVEGGSLAQRLSGTPLGARDAATLLSALAGAVQAAHAAGIVHRDLKPANVLLTADGVPKITDFGLARRLGGDAGLTGAAVGTPSYMAPEQARGNAGAVGPAADVYALGAILYELLTGRPPFRAETAAATLQQVLADDPVPPSRLNPRVPRDLETICLKCLHKEPARRYASARELAEDLGRFLAGQPVRARPVGVAGRAAKWVRRRPAAALLVAALLVLFGVAAGAGLWLHEQEAERQSAKARRAAQAREAVETALGRADDFRQAEKWPEALQVVTEASTHLAEADSPPLEERLKQARADFTVAADLQRVREGRPLGLFREIDYGQRAREFDEAFERAGLRVGEDVQPVADAVRASAIRDPLVAALEDRAMVAFLLEDYPSAERLLAIARSADPEPRWRDRFRQLSAWRDSDKRLRLAAEAFTVSPPPPAHDLALLGCLLRRTGISSQGIEMLREACRRQPGDFWLKREMGDSLRLANRNTESAAYYRAALALRPDNAGVHRELGKVLLASGQVDAALAEFRRAVQLSPDQSPDSRSSRQNLVGALGQAGRWVEAAEECRKALAVDPGGYRPPYALGMALFESQRDAEATAMLRTAIDADPDVPDPYYYLGLSLMRAGRHVEAVTCFRRVVGLTPRNGNARELLARELAAVGSSGEALHTLLTGIALDPRDVGLHTRLGELHRTQGRLAEAAATFRKAADLLPESAAAWDGLAGSLLEQGRFAEARAATERLLGLPATDATRKERRRQLDLCDALHSVGADLPAAVAGIRRPVKPSTQLAVAEWCLTHKRRTAAAARLYGTALAADPAAADEPEAGHRVRAARAAAQACSGKGADAGTLDDAQRGKLRRKALDWLTAELEARTNRYPPGKPVDRPTAPGVGAWLHDEDLAGVRDEQALARLPVEERRAWQSLWADVAARDPVEWFERARAHVARQEWGKAAACYARGFDLEPTEDGELWFEYAAAQLLAHDRPGYRRTCARMLARGRSSPGVRPYLVARACTLAPDSVDDWGLPRRLSEGELNRSAAEPWSLTERAALQLRAGDDRQLGLLERSLAADGRPGNAVLNWLWLAFAYRQAGRTEEARRWLDKAAEWLDQQGGRMPPESPIVRMHRHDWLEAHVLRREAEGLLRSSHASPTRTGK